MGLIFRLLGVALGLLVVAIVPFTTNDAGLGFNIGPLLRHWRCGASAWA